MLGTLIIRLALAAAVLAVVAYNAARVRPSVRSLSFARSMYHVAVLSLMCSSAFFIYLIMTHQFQYAYVWNYSSTDLPGPLLFSTFYAGQEGSFNLWALFTGLIGVLLMQYASKKGYESELMSIYTLIFAFLLLMLNVKDPFTYIWDAFPKELIHTGPVSASVVNYQWIDQAKGIWAQYPTEGKGLNPLLQNYWMVIHPPILFIGFTSMSIPFAMAVAGMLKRDYVSWIRVSTPWTVFGALALGTGIILGGYWAYETLGWGGYWGWDPVENSSLIPWLVCVASIHTMLSQRRSGSFIRTNFVLSILCFVLVLYSTFLTRSGVLGDTSVHSFVEPGMWVYWLLLGMIVVFLVIGFGLFFIRMKEMPRVPVEHSLLSREFALFLGASALVFASIFIVIGTSSPIITDLLRNKKSAVEVSYYVKTTLPLGIVIALLSGIGQLLWWKNSDSSTFLKSLRLPLALAALFTTAGFLIGAHHLIMLVFIFFSAFALFANLEVGYRIINGNPRMAGGAIAHIGISLMFVGFVASAKYDDKETVSLEQGKQVEALGYTMRYVGYHPIDRGRFAFNVEVEKEGRTFILSPVMLSNRDDEGMIRNPDIVNLMTRDFYLSPLSFEVPDAKNERTVTLEKDEGQNVDDYLLQYLGYTFSSSVEKGNVVVVKLDVTRAGKTEHLALEMHNKRGEITYVPGKLSGSDATFTIKGMTPNRGDRGKSSVTLGMSGGVRANGPAKAETLVVEASIKPFINFVWLGTYAMIAGFIITILRRSREGGKKTEG